MELKIKNDTYFVSWSYQVHAHGDGFPRQLTYCTLKLNNVIVGESYTICNPKDTFVKDIGRKTSLARFLENVYFEGEKLTKSEREEVWRQYLLR